MTSNFDLFKTGPRLVHADNFIPRSNRRLASLLHTDIEAMLFQMLPEVACTGRL